MKNPFERKDHKALIIGIAAGSLAGAIAYLFLTETGGTIRQQLTGHVNRILDTIKGGQAETAADEAPEELPYHKAKHKAPKTDREKLLKNEILTDHGDAAAAE